MKAWMKVALAVLVAVVIGAGGYLAYDFFTAERDQNDIRRLAAQVAEIEGLQGEDRRPMKPVDARVTLTGATMAGAGEGAVLDANGIPMPTPERTGQPVGFDGEGLVEVITATIKESASFANPAIEGLEMQISPPLGAKAPSVSALAVGAFLRSTPNLEGLEGKVSVWLKEQGYREKALQTLELSVQVEMPVLEQYAGLYQQNEDMIGWIRIAKTQVNYPVMQTPEDPEHYLRANFEGKYAYCGLPFLDARNDAYAPDQNLIVYAHNMKNGTMFGTMQEYKKKAYWEQHPIVRFDLLCEEREYEVFAMFQSKEYKMGEEGFRYYEYITLGSKEMYDEYVAQVKAASVFDTGITPEWGEEIMTMSTCSYHTEDGSFVVVARRVA